MFDYLEEKWEMLCDDIEKGIINPDVKITPELRLEYERKFKPNPKRAAELRREFEKGFDLPIVPRIWPKVVWVYGMMGGNLKVYVEKLRKSIGYDIPIHNMGFAAAEGFFAMATELDVDDSVLLPHCIFFEFIPVNEDNEEDAELPSGDPKTLLIGDLEVGKKYEMVITNFSGLYRYRMEDVVEVTKMYNNTPRIELSYRKNLVMNLASEKTTTQMVDFATKNTADKTGNELIGYSFYADYAIKPPRYCMLVETGSPVSEDGRQELIDTIDEELKAANEKYLYYRRWDLINRPEVLLLRPKTYWDYSESLRKSGVVLNQVKPVTVINKKERRDFLLACFDRKFDNP